MTDFDFRVGDTVRLRNNEEYSVTNVDGGVKLDTEKFYAHTKCHQPNGNYWQDGRNSPWDIVENATKTIRDVAADISSNKAINCITRDDVEYFRNYYTTTNGVGPKALFATYRRIATKSAIYPGYHTPMGLVYVALKLNGEAGELAEVEAHDNANLIKELGDIIWYLGALQNEMIDDLEFIPFTPPSQPVSLKAIQLSINGIAGRIAEQVGKAMRDDNFITVETTARNSPSGMYAHDVRFGQLTYSRHQEIKSLADELMDRILTLCTLRGFTLHQIMLANLEKLLDRTERNALRGSGDDR